MRIEFDTRDLDLDPRAFYSWATLALGVEVIVAGGLLAWWLFAIAVCADAAAYWRMRWWARRLRVPPPEPRRVHGLCMFCHQDVFFDPMELNAGICDACAGRPA